MSSYYEMVSERNAILREVIALSPDGLPLEQRMANAGRINDLMGAVVRLQDLIYEEEVAHAQRS
jgi:hypothetical protein